MLKTSLSTKAPTMSSASAATRAPLRLAGPGCVNSAERTAVDGLVSDVLHHRQHRDHPEDVEQRQHDCTADRCEQATSGREVDQLAGPRRKAREWAARPTVPP